VRPTAFAKPESTPAAGELDAYLNMDIGKADNVFAWWKRQRSTYPPLSCVVLDFLTIPGMSVARHPYVFTIVLLLERRAALMVKNFTQTQVKGDADAMLRLATHMASEGQLCSHI
jgi:hypothetical protein